MPVFDRGTDVDPVEIATWGVQQARQQGRDTVIVDTAGRLHVDDDLMRELVRIRDAVKPDTTLLVLDSMTGQDAVNVAETFREQVQFDGIVMTKLDGDARGGAALSVRAVTGMPILFASVGEKLDQLEEFHPDRMASRILGMGDVLSLIERIEESVDQRSGRADGGEAPQAGVHAGRPAGAAADDPEDGIAGRADEDDPRSGQADCGTRRWMTGSSIGSRRLSCP